MVRSAFDGLDIVKALTSYDYRIVDRTGSHVKLRLDRADIDEPRIVTVPLKSRDQIPTGTLRSISEQCGANDFRAWCEWIDDAR